MIYYFIISLGASAAALWFVRRAQRARQSLIFAADLALVVMAAGFVGARLTHIVYEEPAFYRDDPWRVLQFWYGGFVYLGGLLGALLAGALFCDRRKQPFWYWADLAAPPAALAYAVGRIGCFFNGCCYGRICALPWAVDNRHPTQLYASLWESLAIVALLTLEPRLKKTPGALAGLWLMLHGIGRVIMEAFRDDPRGPLLMGLSLGTWLSYVLIASGSTLFAHHLVPRLHKRK